MAKLVKHEIAGLLIGRASGVKQKTIASALNCSVDTVRRIQNKYADQLELFVKVHGAVGEELYELADKTKILYAKGTVCAYEFIVTGDPKDGVIYANDLYSEKLEEGEMMNDENFENWAFYDTDIGVMKRIRVGKIVIRIEPEYHRKEDIKDIAIVDSSLPEVRFEDDKNFALVDNPAYEPNGPFDDTHVSEEEDSKDKYVEATWTASAKFISIVKGRKTYNADSTHDNFQEALQMLIDGDVETAIDLINTESAVTKYVKGNIEIKDGQLFYKGFEVRSGLTTRIINSMQAGEDFEFYLPFLENLMLNPSERAVTRLFDFLQANDIEITDDGYFIAWKKVSSDFKDLYTGTIDNSPGKIVEMPRNMVNENDHETCSNGLHVCSKSYLDHYATSYDCKVMKVKVHPRDVVSIPVDYNNAKMRTCKYEVLGEAN
ncbi:rIIB protector from prophage-induced lysis [Acinetobacter phage AB-Navy1]|nr:rIIB protector from prophage-induced lysis [Acinetobacter phage AB-Navy1]